MGTDIWPHKSPYGVNVGFSDGHASWVGTGRGVYDKSREYPLSDEYQNDSFRDGFAVFFFKACDKGDFSRVLELDEFTPAEPAQP